MRDFIRQQQLQYLVFTALAAVVVVLSGVQRPGGAGHFLRYTGGVDPLVATLLVAALGAVLLSVLLVRGEFVVLRSDRRTGLLPAGGLALVFGAIIIPADFLIVYPRDINVPWPDALLFYPVVGFLAEIVLHVLPLTLLLLALRAVFRTASREKIVWVAIVATALLEPIYQTSWMQSAGPYPFAAVAFDALHVFLINLAELILFRRHGFVSMYALRLAYYLIWHIGWGHLRLSILF